MSGVFTALPLAAALWLLILAGIFVSPLVPLVFFGVIAVAVFVTGERVAWRKR